MAWRFPLLALAQAMIVIAAAIPLAFWPPERGPMLLVPLAGAAGMPINAMLAGGGALLGRGPLPGSIVVLGDRARIAAAIGGRAILLLAAPRAACGGFAGYGAS